MYRSVSLFLVALYMTAGPSIRTTQTILTRKTLAIARHPQLRYVQAQPKASPSDR